MNSAKDRVRGVARQQLDRRFNEIRQAFALLQRPSSGWINAVRAGFGMSQADLAQRMGVSRQAISQLEQREVDGSATINALEEAARALGGRLVYAVVPECPISETLEKRAMRLARQMITSVRHTMRLEDQEPDSDLDDRTRQLAKHLLMSPEKLWSVRDDV